MTPLGRAVALDGGTAEHKVGAAAAPASSSVSGAQVPFLLSSTPMFQPGGIAPSPFQLATASPPVVATTLPLGTAPAPSPVVAAPVTPAAVPFSPIGAPLYSRLGPAGAPPPYTPVGGARVGQYSGAAASSVLGPGPPTGAVVATAPPPPQQRGPTVYLGHLKSDLEDTVVRHLLSECGRVVRWSRTQDPSTKKLSTFGFCEFESPLGVIRSVRCLSGLVLDGQALVANCEDKVKEGLEQWRRDRHNKLQEENPAKSAYEIEAEIEKEDLRIEQSVKKIAADYNQRCQFERAKAAAAAAAAAAEAAAAEAAAASQAKASPTAEGTDAPAPEGSSDGQSIKSPEEGALPGQDRGAVPPSPSSASQPHPPPQQLTPRQQHQSQSSQYNRNRPQRGPLGSDAYMPGFVDLSSAVRISYREAERIQIWNNRLKENRNEYRKRVAAWERREAQMMRDRKRRQEAAQAVAKEPNASVPPALIKRLLDLDHRDIEYYFTHDGGIWEGPFNSRRAEERARRIKAELEADTFDAEAEQREKEEEARLEMLRREEEEKRLQEENRMREEAEAARKAAEEEAQRAAAAETAAADAVMAEAASDDTKAGDGVAQTADAKGGVTDDRAPETEAEGRAASAPVVINVKLGVDPVKAPARGAGASLPFAASEVVAPAPTIAGIFGEVEEEDAGRTLTTKMDFHLDREAEAAKALEMEKQRQLVAKITSQIPQDEDELFNFAIDWGVLEKHNLFETKVSPWIGKKVTEFLGEAEPELTSYITTRLQMEDKPSAREFLEELKEFFEEDATGFVVKLWKLLIFESLRLTTPS